LEAIDTTTPSGRDTTEATMKKRVGIIYLRVRTDGHRDLTRSTIMAFSNSAKTPHIWNMARPRAKAKGVKLGRGSRKDGERSADEERWGVSKAELAKRIRGLRHQGKGIITWP
jgi:hypothetical protein